MKPPPPMLPAAGYVTAIANAVATVASTALPPFLRMSRPISTPGGDTATTMPCFPSAVALAAVASRSDADNSVSKESAVAETGRRRQLHMTGGPETPMADDGEQGMAW